MYVIVCKLYFVCMSLQSFQRVTVGRYLLHPEVDGQSQFDNNTISGLTGVLTRLLSAATDLLPVSDDVKT